jgi:anti-sigma B factor antagonist
MADLGASRATLTLHDTEDGRLVIILSGELDVDSARALEADVAELLQRQGALSVTVNVTELAFADSSGLALLLRVADRFGPLDVAGARPLIRDVIQATGLDQVLRPIEGQRS